MQEREWGEWGEEIVDRETIELVEVKGRQRRRWWFKVKVGCFAHVGTGLRKFHSRHFPDPDSDFSCNILLISYPHDDLCFDLSRFAKLGGFYDFWEFIYLFKTWEHQYRFRDQA